MSGDPREAPGRLVFGSASELAQALLRAGAAHGPNWYARSFEREQSGGAAAEEG
jgi:hypothetical protein